MLEAQYPSDADFLAKMKDEDRDKFEQWFARLDAAHERRGNPYGNGSLSKLTGIECWATFFEEGAEPEDALDEDLSYAYE